MQGALFVCGNEGCEAGKGIFGKLRQGIASGKNRGYNGRKCMESGRRKSMDTTQKFTGRAVDYVKGRPAYAEAFLQSLESRSSQPLPDHFKLTAVEHCSTKVVDIPESNHGPLYVLDLPPFTTYLMINSY